MARGALFLLALAACGDDAAAPAPPPVTPAPAKYPTAEQLPTLRITTSGGAPITSKETYVAATYTLTDADGKEQLASTLEIRGRGNSTWDLFPKKPYRLKLGSSAALLGMPASRHWVLLANYSDKTLMRNDVAFQLSRTLGMEWTPRAQSIDVHLNGSYQGVYQLVEQVRIAPERVNVPEMKVSDTTASTISGGYLIEVDERRGEAFCFRSTWTPMIFCLSSPETLLEPAWSRQRQYIEQYMRDVDAAIFGASFADPATGYAAYLDVESAVNYYVLNELFKNVDGNLRLSTYLFKKRDGKLTFGPVWDFDLAIGNVNYNGADRIEGWHIRTAPWFTRMFQDPAFAARVKARWDQLKRDKVLEALVEYMEERRFFLQKAQAANFTKWPILGTWVWPNRVVTGSYYGEVAAAQQWLWARKGWMDAQFAAQ